jgi:hypothetical protein
MKWFLIAVSIAAVLAVAASGASIAGADPPRAHLRAFRCQPAVEPAQREVSIEAVMRPLEGTRRMELRVELLSRAKPGAPLTSVSGPGLGDWVHPSDPTLGQQPGDEWIVDHPVVGLDAPAIYHFRVTFKWIGAHGRTLGSAVRTSPPCFQPELRPDLLVKSITVEPASRPTQNMYLVQIGNSGATGAGPFEVLFAPGGANPVKTRTVHWLGAHMYRDFTFIGPPCTAATDPTVTVDPQHQIDELDPTNNSLTATCPGP